MGIQVASGILYIQCDKGGCNNESPKVPVLHDKHHYKETEKTAANKGWVEVGNGKWYCPDHADLLNPALLLTFFVHESGYSATGNSSNGY